MKKRVLLLLLLTLITTACNKSNTEDPTVQEVVETNPIFSSDEEAIEVKGKNSSDNERSDEESFKIIQKTLDTVALKGKKESNTKDNYTYKPFKIVKMEDKHKDAYYWSVWTQSKNKYHLETKMYNTVLKDGTFDFIDPSGRDLDDPLDYSLLEDPDVMKVDEWDFPENVNKDFYEVDYSTFE